MLDEEPFLRMQSTNLCKAMLGYLNESLLPADENLGLQIVMLHNDFNISDGGMLLRIAASSSKPGVITAQAVVPVTLRAVVMQAAHDDATALHAGIAATQMRIMENALRMRHD